MTRQRINFYEDLGTILSSTFKAIRIANVVSRLSEQFSQEIKKFKPGKYIELCCQFQKSRVDGGLLNGTFVLTQYDTKSKAEENANYDSTHALLPDGGWLQVACVLGPDSYPNPFAGGRYSWFCVFFN